MIKKILLGLILNAALISNSNAQTNSTSLETNIVEKTVEVTVTTTVTTNPPAGNGFTSIAGTLKDFWEPNATNGLLNAKELDLAIFTTWSRSTDLGVGGRLSYFITDQQGTELTFIDFLNGSSEIDVGYCTRTTFKDLEVRISIGARQKLKTATGDVQLYNELSGLYKLPFKKADIRLFLSGQFVVNDHPRVFFGISVPFHK